MEKGTTVGCAKIAALFDAGTFVETGAFMKRGDDLTGVVCGYGAVNGKLVYAFAQDSDRKKGAIDALQAEKIAMLYSMAQRNGAPVVGMFDSVGATVADGASVLSAYGKLLKVVSDASGIIPQIAIINGVCAGMAATVAAMFDVVVTIKDKSELYVNAPFLAGKEIGTTDYTAQNGLASITAESEEDAVAKAVKLVSMLPSNCEEGVAIEDITDDINRTVAVEGQSGKELVQTLADANTFVALGEAYATEMITGIACFGGVTCGVVANDASVNGGVITCDCAKKAAKLISFCDSFSIPVVTLVDSIGVATGAEAEGAPLAAQLGKLAMAYATADTAKIGVVCGKAYGAAFTLMGSKALGADMVYALPTSEISVMAPASAVAFLWNDKITEEVTRADLIEKWTKECASPEAAAADGSIDDVVKANELRQRICAAVYMLMMKNAGAPARKHCNLPL
jgi:acetyl-CoA carboxylase carboxyltransferase component